MKINTRIQVTAIFFFLGFVVVLAKLFYWQIVKGNELSDGARSQYENGFVLTAPRGSILAKDGSWLVARENTWTVSATITEIEDAQETAERIAPYFVEYKEAESEEEDVPDPRVVQEEEEDRLRKLLTRPDSVWVPLKHNVSEEVKNEIEALGFSGINFDPQEARMYPEASAAAHLLGFVGKNEYGESVGYNGLEGYYDLMLTGKPGFYSREADARGIPILIGGAREVVAVGGVDIKTHIDKSIQLLLEKKLQEGMVRYEASAATGIVMNPKTGAIISMASFPSYDPATYSKWSNQLFRNPSVSDSFEPGSIFKPLVMAAALDMGVVKPDTKCDTCDQAVKIGMYTIDTWDSHHYPDSTMTEVIVHSDNIGMVFVGRKIGQEKLYEYISNFGIGKLTGIDLQGEVNPALRQKDKWGEIDAATSTFGQGVAVTPIQIITAIAAIANDGVLVTPQVVSHISGKDWETQIKPEEKGRVISKNAADEVTAMMYEASIFGQSRKVLATNYKIAGKTGTAQVPVSGYYDKDKTVASYVGFAPYDDPKFVMLMILDEPKTNKYAEYTTVPLWYETAKEIFMHLGISPLN